VAAAKAKAELGRSGSARPRHGPAARFLDALENKKEAGEFGLIAEIKKASPPRA
jgi:indole-3-glycerol phosphate synthase